MLDAYNSLILGVHSSMFSPPQNCSFDPNLKRRMHPQGNGLYHPSMASDPWEGLSSEDKPMFK